MSFNKRKSIKNVIFIFIYIFIAGISVLNFFLSFTQQRRNLRETFSKHGLSLATNLANNSRGAMQTKDRTALYVLIDSLMKEPDIRWGAIVDPQGQVIVESGLGGVTLGAVSAGNREGVLYALPNGQKILDLPVEVVAKQQVDSGGRADAFVSAGMFSELDFSAPPQIAESKDVVLGTVHVGLSMQGLDQAMRTMGLQQIILLLIMLGLGTVAGLWLANLIVRPIHLIVGHITRSIQDIADSRADLTQPITMQREDEFGGLIESYNIFQDTLRRIIKNTLDHSEHVNVSLMQIASTSEELNSTSEEINAAVQMFHSELERQEVETSQTVKRIEDITNMLAEITHKSKFATQISNETKDVSRQGVDKVQESVRKMQVITENIQVIDNRMSALSLSLNDIVNFVESIQGIASQTDLLSLNAAIEAARAGESGRGFSVVAEEVRKLAENASNASRNIQEIINHISSGVQEANTVTQQGVEIVNQERESINQAGTTLGEIMEATCQSALVAEEISFSLMTQFDLLKQMTESIRKVQTIGKNNLTGSQTMAASVEEQTASLEQVNIAIQNLAEDARKLKDQVKGFKVD